MKRIQIGFAAIIAVLAMSFTIAEHNGAFKSKAVKLTDDCFKPGGTNGLKIRSTCTSSTTTIGTSSACSITTAGDHVWSLDVSNVIASGSIALSCQGSGTICCFQVVDETNTCTSPNTQPTFDIGTGTAKAYKVGTVYCKGS